MKKSSRLKGFYKLNRGERIDLVRAFSQLPVDQIRLIGQDGSLPFDITDLFIENAIGSYPLPLGVATNFRIDGEDVLVPMAVEESSVVAAASNAARWIYESGGFATEVVDSLMIGQIQVLDLDPAVFPAVTEAILSSKAELLRLANETHPRLLMRGGGARDIEVRSFPDAEVPFLVVHILLDPKDAMGANLVNTVCERLAPEIARMSQGRTGLRILSNLADRRVFRATARVLPKLLEVKGEEAAMPGEEIARRIFEAYVFADSDPYRATTHNKGIMNGVDPVVIATGNDWRAIEAGAHAYAATKTGRYRSLSTWRVDPADGQLVGTLEIPLQLGTVGGVTRLHPMAKLSLQILGNPNANQLGRVIACAGLASNLAALRALTTTGIQKGHMKLHAKNLALGAGAKGEEVEVVAHLMVRDGQVSATSAEQILAAYRERKRQDQPAQSIDFKSLSELE